MKRQRYGIVTILLALSISLIAVVCMLVLTFGKEDGSAKAEIVEKTENMVVIKVNETEGFATLLDAMNYLKNERELTFEIVGGMISSIEGKSNPADFSSCWMLFTSDEEMSNAEWGTTTYNGNTYASAILGAESLTVSAGEYYVLEYVTF